MKSLPEEILPDFEPTATLVDPGGKFPDALAEGQRDEFACDSAVLSGIANDPLIRREIGKIIEVRIRETSKAEWEAEKLRGYETGLEEGRKAGFEKGLLEGGVEWAEIRKRLNEMAERIHEEKVQILKSHEPEWLDAMQHLFSQCHLAQTKNVMEMLQRFVSSKIDTFSKDGKLTVRVSEKLHDQLKPFLASGDTTKWHIIADSSLAPDAMIVEVDTHGYLFTPQTLLNDVTALIQQEKERSA